MSHKIGERVYYKPYGYGIVCDISEDDKSYGINFDVGRDNMHTCEGICPEHHGWYVNKDSLTFCGLEDKCTVVLKCGLVCTISNRIVISKNKTIMVPVSSYSDNYEHEHDNFTIMEIYVSSKANNPFAISGKEKVFSR